MDGLRYAVVADLVIVVLLAPETFGLDDDGLDTVPALVEDSDETLVPADVLPAVEPDGLTDLLTLLPVLTPPREEVTVLLAEAEL